MNDLKTLLNHLPYKLAAYDAQGNFLYDNGGADGSFFPREPENLPDWIMSEVLASPTKERSYQIPTDSFDQILIQTYQAAIDNEGNTSLPRRQSWYQAASHPPCHSSGRPCQRL